MLLEVSASPKPGNVDREHNYPDTFFEHFIASSVSVYPTIEMAARSRSGIGALFRMQFGEFCLATGWQYSFWGSSITDSPSNGCGRIITFKREVRCELSPEELKNLLHVLIFLSGQQTVRMLSNFIGLLIWQESG